MSDNIFSTDDDDIFQDYVDSDSTDVFSENTTADTPQPFDKLLADVDSPFKKLLQNSSLKVNLGEAFYAAADEWVNLGYKEANASAIVKELAELTQGRFLYKHRLECCKEVIARKKTIIRFLNIILDKDQEKNIVAAAVDDFKLNLSESYFDMFFRSYYNIEMFMLQHEIALYKSLCDIMQIDKDLSLIDLNTETDVINNTADVINDLYIQYFDKDNLEERMNEYVKEFRAKEA
jgi:hypothetical protein